MPWLRDTIRPARDDATIKACGRGSVGLGTRQGWVVNWDDTIIDASASDTGMRRSNNQDSHTVVRAKSAEQWRQRGHVYMVADGMGAHAVGELASKLACDNIPHNYMKLRSATPAEAITKAYQEVGSQIHAKATANRDFHGMGTTCSTLLLLPAGAMIAHVGDSRVYRIRGNQIDQLTFDHSLVWELVRRNHLTNEQASKAVPRNVITRSLGPDPTVEVDIEGPLPIEEGDVYLLCSDGLSGPVEDPELGVFAANFHPEDATKYLLHLANLRGGQDNITVVILRIGPWSHPEDPPIRGGRGPESGSGELTTIKPNGRSPKGGGFSLAKIAAAFQKKPEQIEVEEHRYRSAECPIFVTLLDRLMEEIRATQARAVQEAWPVDWAELTKSRRQADEAKAAGNLRKALKHIGDSIVRLGVAGRYHKKDQGPTGSR
jgi:PPM family protein phosphatase